MLLNVNINEPKEEAPLSQKTPDWLIPLMEILTEKYIHNETVAFQINGMRKSGFLVKVMGAFAFVPFSRMPWKYFDLNYWTVVYPFLLEKVFYGKIQIIQKDAYRMILHADLPQFKHLSFQRGMPYEGVVLKKFYHGLLIEFGYHFKWLSGSMPGYVHHSHFKRAAYHKIEPGILIETIYEEQNEKDHAIFMMKPPETNTDQMTEQLDLVEVLVVKLSGRNDVYQLPDGFTGLLPLNSKLYGDMVSRVASALNHLNHHDVIHCRVLGMDFETKTTSLEWCQADEIEQAFQKKGVRYNEKNTIGQRIGEETLYKLQVLRDGL